MQRLDGLDRRRSDPVQNRHHAQQLPVHPEMHGRLAVLHQPFRLLFQQADFDFLAVHQPSVAEQHPPALDLRLHAFTGQRGEGAASGFEELVGVVAQAGGTWISG